MSQVQSTAPAAAAASRLRRSLRWAGNPFGRIVGRLPVKVRTKLLVGFLAIAALLVLIALFGLRVLGQANTRAERLGALQQRVAGYTQLQTEAVEFRHLLGLCAGGSGAATWANGGKPTAGPGPKCLRRIGGPVNVSLGLLGQATDLGFRPTQTELPVFRSIRKDYASLNRTITRFNSARGVSPGLHKRAENLATDLETASERLAQSTKEASSALIEQNRRSYASSRNLFIGVAAGAVGLALILGFLLSWSLIYPIQGIGRRLAEIARGDFSEHVEVSNRDELGTLARNVNQMNDELKRLYRELELASEHKSQFLANMSHELRTPLNAILGFTQVLKEKLFGEVNDKQEEYLGDILSSSNHLLSLINDILDLSKVEAGQVELEVATFSLRDAVERGVVMIRERASEHGVALSLKTDSSVELVEGDERRIRQVIFNLLSNAVKFTPEGGQIEVSTARANGEIRVAVADTGPGISEDDQERIFQEFQQTEVGERQGEGTGLGLALSKRLVELHGGRIWVESVVGQGTTFIFGLPVGSDR